MYWLYDSYIICTGCTEVYICALNAPFYVSGTPFLPSLAVFSGWNSYSTQTVYMYIDFVHASSFLGTCHAAPLNYVKLPTLSCPKASVTPSESHLKSRHFHGSVCSAHSRYCKTGFNCVV